jgi:hypothetical protein
MFEVFMANKCAKTFWMSILGTEMEEIYETVVFNPTPTRLVVRDDSSGRECYINCTRTEDSIARTS